MLDDLVTQMMQSECKDIPERLTEEKTLLQLHSGSVCSVSIVVHVLNTSIQTFIIRKKGTSLKGNLCCMSKLNM